MFAFQPLSDFDSETFLSEHIEDGEGPGLFTPSSKH